jgi:hypothetical protein
VASFARLHQCGPAMDGLPAGGAAACDRPATPAKKSSAKGVMLAIVSIGFVSPAVASARGGFHGGGYRSVSWGGGLAIVGMGQTGGA